MKIAGVIAEYNPITNGHIYHLEKTREMSRADFVVAVMSGDFTQRGMPVAMDKWTRSRLAAESGADLVVELPFVYATGSAEMFARGGIGILDGLGIVDTVSFGSESGDLDQLKRLADLLAREPDPYKGSLKKHLQTGMSFPAARQAAVSEEIGGDAACLLEEPNNILAIEYLKQIIRISENRSRKTDHKAETGSKSLQPVTIRRIGRYNDEVIPDKPDTMDGRADDRVALASASAVRAAAEEGRFDELAGAVPENCLNELRQIYDGNVNESEKPFSKMKQKYFDMLRTVILRSSPRELSQIAGVSEGIENRIKREIRSHDSFDSFAGAIKSKRFTRTAIGRMMIHILAGLTAGEENLTPPLYARVLAFNENGAQLIKLAKKASEIPIITNINKAGITDPAVSSSLDQDILASDLYNMICGRDLYKYSDHVTMPCFVR